MLTQLSGDSACLARLHDASADGVWVQAATLAAMPARFFRDVPEIPISFLVLSSVAAVLLTCLMDVLPYAVYVTATRDQTQQVNTLAKA